MLDSRGNAKLADFGLVRSLSELKLAGVPLAGTPTFMAPELFSGIPASPRSDIYAVGVMYYYLLSGLLPFTSDQISHLIQRHRREPAPDIRRVNPAVPDVVAAVLEQLSRETAGRALSDRRGTRGHAPGCDLPPARHG